MCYHEQLAASDKAPAEPDETLMREHRKLGMIQLHFHQAFQQLCLVDKSAK